MSRITGQQASVGLRQNCLLRLCVCVSVCVVFILAGNIHV